VAARRKAERSVPLSAVRVRSSCPPGTDGPRRSRQSPPPAAASKGRQPPLWLAVQPLAVLRRAFPSRPGELCAPWAPQEGPARGGCGDGVALVPPPSSAVPGRGEPQGRAVFHQDAFRGTPVGVSLGWRLFAAMSCLKRRASR